VTSLSHASSLSFKDKENKNKNKNQKKEKKRKLLMSKTSYNTYSSILASIRLVLVIDERIQFLVT